MAIATRRMRRAVTSALVPLALVWGWPASALADGTAGSSGTAGESGPPTVAAQPADALPGIDVSHHQGDIDWGQVAAAGTRFVIAKATEGRDFDDPLYASYKAGAMAAGLAFGAYHFARPDDTWHDAIKEADHFVDVAQLGPGNLIPALDVERTGGLSQADLTTWILDWLARVTERLGVKPMVYTSPYGWRTRTGDTTAVAEAGYTVLWVAHWGVTSPTVPAEDWAGYGWTFWQYTDCGAVPGIEGCVDLDWHDGTTLDGVTIPNPDVTPPVVSIATPVALDDPAVVSFSEIVHDVTPGNVLLWQPDASLSVPAALTCRSRKGVEADCSTGNVRSALIGPRDPLVAGQSYAVLVNPAGVLPLVVDRAGNAAPTTEHAFAAATEVEQDSAGVVYAWRNVGNRRAYGGEYATEHLAGASYSMAFRGRSATWYTVAGPTQGRAEVSIDGVSKGVFDQYAPRSDFKVARRFVGLPAGWHTIVVRVLGRGAGAATDTQVAIDAFAFGGNLVRNPAGIAEWRTVKASSASGGSLATADLARASAELAFRGTAVDWYTVRGPTQGRASIYVDGALIRTVDNYADAPSPGVVRSVTGLIDGVHTLRIVVLGLSRPKASGALVSIDRFVVTP